MKRELVAVVTFCVVTAVGVTRLPDVERVASNDDEPSLPAICEWVPGDPHLVGFGPSTTASRSGSLSLAELADIAVMRGLNYVAVIDRKDFASLGDPAYDSSGLRWLFGVDKEFPAGEVIALGWSLAFSEPALTRAGLREFVRDVHTAQGVITLGEAENSHWTDRWLRALDPDAVEVWRAGAFAFSVPGQEKNPVRALHVYDSILDGGEKAAAVGGSALGDRALTDVAGPGQPTTSVCVDRVDAQAVADAMRMGRTTISTESPFRGGPLVFLEGDQDGDGVFEEQVGDSIPPGSRLRVTVQGAPAARVRLIVEGSRMLEELIVDAEEFTATFEAPAGSPWVRAELYLDESLSDTDQQVCPDPESSSIDVGQIVSYCGGRFPMLALSSPIYIE